MGLTIAGPDTGPIPRQTILVFECDGDHGLLPRPRRLEDQGSYIEQHARMIAAGWSETSLRILCPECNSPSAAARRRGHGITAGKETDDA